MSSCWGAPGGRHAATAAQETAGQVRRGVRPALAEDFGQARVAERHFPGVQGGVIPFFPSKVAPEAPELRKAIDEALAR
jgi:hypothetical protein